MKNGNNFSFLKVVVLYVLCSVSQNIFAQVLVDDDFDLYPKGQSLNDVNNTFWAFAPDSYKISDDKAFSGTKSVELNWVGNSSNIFFKIPSFEESYEISFMFWMKPAESADFSIFNTFPGGVGFRQNGHVIKYGSINSQFIPYENKGWNQFRIVYRANHKIVYFYINDRLIGSSKFRFINNTNFNINLYGNTGMFVDDFKLIKIESLQRNHDIGFIQTSVEYIDMEKQPIDMSVAVYNFGKTDVTGIMVEREYNGETRKTRFDDIIRPDTFLTLTFPDTFLMETGEKSFSMKVYFVDQNMIDEKPEDNVFVYSTKGISTGRKKVLLEYVTGTWCGTCPAAVVSYRNFKSKFKDQVSSIFAHVGDIMELEVYNFPEVEGIPSGFYNRRPMTYLLSDFDIILELDQDVELEMDTRLVFEENSGTYKVISNLTSVKDIDEPLYHNIVVVEDSIRGTTPEYRQSNFYSGGTLGPMGGFELLPSVIPADQMVYSNVPRLLVNGMFGKKFSFGMSSGQNTEINQVVDLKPEMIKKHFYVYHIIFDINRNIKHFTRVHIPDILEIQSETHETSEELVRVYPNPVSDYLYVHSPTQIESWTLYHTSGQMLSTTKPDSESTTYKIDTTDMVPGVYTLQIKTALKSQMVKFIKI